MKSNDDFSLDKENIVGKTVRKERKCFAAGCISALCLLFTIPAPFLSTWTDRLSARQHRKLLLRAMHCYVFSVLCMLKYNLIRRLTILSPARLLCKRSVVYLRSVSLLQRKIARTEPKLTLPVCIRGRKTISALLIIESQCPHSHLQYLQYLQYLHIHANNAE